MRLIRSYQHWALLFVVILMAVETPAMAQNRAASSDGVVENSAKVRHFLVAQENTLLTIDWERHPKVQDGGIYGSVTVKVSTDPRPELTLSVVALNKYGKAFVLGYQRITSQQELGVPFGVRLPAGEYVVHMDAIAEIPSIQTIYHAHRHGLRLRVEGS